MEMAKLAFSLQGISMMMSLESRKIKTQIIVQGFVFGICALVMTGFYWGRTASIMNSQTIAERGSFSSDKVAYDVSCGAPFSDQEAANDLLEDISKDCDRDCLNEGSRWSHAFFANAIVTLLITVNMICVCIGAKVPFSRLIASICAFCLCCAHFPIIITTAVYRFRPYGMYCALSERNTYFADTDSDSTDDWTYAKDGALLLALWIIQLLCCCCCCGVGMSGTGKRDDIGPLH